ncbi:hypothetical protein M409DRAFT_35706 [Zasmidium cellare ATCC 36951]|uniref:Transcription factor domain-containing protein n=1 Tax=Zasmidium cellare ATCC 36951 TaxID=1080233 RepID=A0A6A6D312_ZASCE|nr:uncharacterized protein M409DRAFT_35706 [Zasmidium cellare ATCC 36951]KAF2172046.1 hypothetical protein M409DRAFT_35706 [Zasmidium cellare ATCC 36951]
MPRYISQPAECVLPDDDKSPMVVLPDQTTTMSYLECFAEHAQVTYRYVPRQQWQSLVTRLYSDDESLLNDDVNMSLLLLVVGLGCIWYPSWKNKEFSSYRTKATRLYRAAKSRLTKVAATFPPTVAAVQAFTLECQLLLTMNHFNTAWLSLGMAIRMGQIIGFQKQHPQPAQADSFEETIRASLVKIIGLVMRKLYPATSQETTWLEDHVHEFEASLQRWLKETPTFFHPGDNRTKTSSDDNTLFEVPWSFKRQQRTVRMTYHFATMLMYRGSLLSEFLRTEANMSRETPPPTAVQKCVQAAVHMASFAADIAEDTTYNTVFWTTSYFTFCAISILLVYLALYRDVDDRAQLEVLLEKAMRGHRKLDQSVNLETQRLLEESRNLASHARPLSNEGADHSTNERLAHQSEITSISRSEPSAIEAQDGPPLRDADFTHDLVRSLTEASKPPVTLTLLQFDLDTSRNNNDLGMILNVGFDCSLPDLFDLDASRHFPG